jgi:hypothetical protein
LSVSTPEPGWCGAAARHLLALSIVISLSTVSDARAQTPQTRSEDFGGLTAGREITVFDDGGSETRGRLLRFTADSLTIVADRRVLVFDRPQVYRVYARGDPLKTGMLIGFLTGAAFGIAAGLGTDCGGFLGPIRPCTGGEKLRLVAVGSGVFGALGLGLGAGIDALITGRRLVYLRPPRAEAPTVTFGPSFGPSGAGLVLSVAW